MVFLVFFACCSPTPLQLQTFPVTQCLRIPEVRAPVNHLHTVPPVVKLAYVGHVGVLSPSLVSS